MTASADREAMAEHARMLHGRCPGYLPAFFLPGATPYFYGSVDELIRDTEDLAELAAIHNYDVYLGTTTLASAPLRGRGGVDDVLAVPALYGDFDVATGIHGTRADGLPLPPTVEEARELITAVGMEPSFVIHSGGGLQAGWLFEDPLVIGNESDRRRVVDLAARFSATLVEHGRRRGVHVDPIGDLARVLRLAGTINHKDKTNRRPVRFLERDPDRRYSVDQVSAAVLEVPVQRPPAHTPAPRRRLRFCDRESPAEVFSRVVTWEEILEPHGWRCVGHRGEERWWRHPTATSKVSATTDHAGIPVLVNFSPNAGLPVGAGHRLTKFRTWAILNFGGDESAAARAIRDAAPRGVV